ncbi:hypothetical protein AZE42_06231 [Rhizopogon vesiculosus]|uniref:DUF6533 domain-containing protein n=1 Tax=Rhizopogon vesiculosus TaxID=180088 RepID=A0A1J8QSU6_9AGAM|nr:hypothetical protein AZE42_06231 [Rhizopogon vesiculosus]
MSTPLYVDAGIQASKYCNVGTFAVLIFDYCITLEAESKWVWHRKWTLVRYIFTISRYLPFFGIGMTFAAALRTQYYPGESCVRYGTASNVLHILCIIAAEGLLITRIYAAWNKDLMFELDDQFCFVTYYIISNTHLIPDLTNTIPLIIPDPGDCLFLNGRDYLEYCALLLYELVISSLSIIITMVPPVTWIAIADSVLASRILFNLRESEERSGTHQTFEDLTDIQFQGGQRSTLISEV